MAKTWDRRAVLAAGSVGLGAVCCRLQVAHASETGPAFFLAEAERMGQQAVAAGDQAYGAVLVLDNKIVGYGPSRVVSDRNPNAHAERVAIWAAQIALKRKDLTGAILYSTSRPCPGCEAAAAEANVARMIHGAGIGSDAGKPQRRS